VCDVIILYLLKKRHLYNRKKFLYVEGDDDYVQPQVQLYAYSLLLSSLFFV